MKRNNTELLGDVIRRYLRQEGLELLQWRLLVLYAVPSRESERYILIWKDLGQQIHFFSLMAALA